MKDIKVENETDLLIMVINLALLLKLPYKYYLTEREKQFLARCAIHSSNGISLESTEIVDLLCKDLNMKTSDIYSYRSKLKKKGWFIQTIDGFDLLPALNFKNKKIPRSIRLDYKIEIAE